MTMKLILSNLFLILVLLGCHYNNSENSIEGNQSKILYEFIGDSDYIFDSFNVYSDSNENAINLYTGYYIVRIDDVLSGADLDVINKRILDRGYVKTNNYKKSIIYCKGKTKQLEILEPHRIQNIDVIDNMGDAAVQLEKQWNVVFYWKKDGNTLCK